MEKTYKELQQEFDRLLKKVQDKEDDCAKKGMPFEDMIQQTSNERNNLIDISQQMRLIQEPVLEFGKTWKGDIIPFDNFKQMCQNKTIVDSDGYGYYATETAKSNIEIYPSDIIENKYRTDFSHVIWFNK